ncbi:MAG: hypothetical protein ACI308_03820 [Muribaculaceae bacterium]
MKEDIKKNDEVVDSACLSEQKQPTVADVKRWMTREAESETANGDSQNMTLNAFNASTNDKGGGYKNELCNMVRGLMSNTLL